MARFDVYANPVGPGWLIDVQTDMLHGLNTRAVVPLLELKDAPLPAGRLNPLFEIGGEKVSMTTQFIAAVPESTLKAPLMNLAAHQDEVTAALDMLFLGF